jgi:hypothetical protein
MPTEQPATTIQVIVPARNEEASLGRCLQSLFGQRGISFQITVVDDGSTDRTRAVAESFPGVRLLGATEPPLGYSGKCNALIRGTEGASAPWLLFTDADTFHYPGSLAAAVGEAEERGVDLLSYSPEQEAVSWGERALMPVVFADLVRTYPPDRINHPADPTVAANGQYVLVRREVYQALGGHAAVASKILEDVELARLFKESDKRIWFRHGRGMVRTRMYRDFTSLVEGWTKNLALLFQRPLALAAARAMEFSGVAILGATAAIFLVRSDFAPGIVSFAAAVLLYGAFIARIRRAHFSASNMLSFFGLPLFSWLLVRSWLRSRPGRAVTWKGRTYTCAAPAGAQSASVAGHSKVES